jgi:hypothetical protein
VSDIEFAAKIFVVKSKIAIENNVLFIIL